MHGSVCSKEVQDLLVCLLAHVFIQSTHSLNHSPTQSLTHSLIQSLTHSLTHPPTHALHSSFDMYPYVSRWGEARYEREANRADRHVPHASASASFTRPGSRPEPAHSRDEAHRPFRDNAPRLARDLAPRPKSYRDGQEARLDREGRPLPPR